MFYVRCAQMLVIAYCTMTAHSVEERISWVALLLMTWATARMERE